jgi:hypothetical protein
MRGTRLAVAAGVAGLGIVGALLMPASAQTGTRQQATSSSSAVSAGSSPTTSAGVIEWASAATAKIHPGVMVTIADVTCRAGYVLTDGRRVFLAMPASCTGVSGGEMSDGCSEAQVPNTLPAKIQGAKYDGKVAYSSFVQMQLSGATAPNKCVYNSIALVKLDRRDIKRTNPSLPIVGGPTGVSRDAPAFPDQLTVLLASPANAQATTTSNNGWAHSMIVDGHVDRLAVGSPVLTENGKALGMVTFIPPQGGPGETKVGDFYKIMRSLRNHAGFENVHLAKGTAEYTPASTLNLG